MVINSGPRTDTLPVQIQNGLKDQAQRENVLPVTLLSGFLVSLVQSGKEDIWLIRSGKWKDNPPRAYPEVPRPWTANRRYCQ